jgi:hypothetical protein
MLFYVVVSYQMLYGLLAYVGLLLKLFFLPLSMFSTSFSNLSLNYPVLSPACSFISLCLHRPVPSPLHLFTPYTSLSLPHSTCSLPSPACSFTIMSLHHFVCLLHSSACPFTTRLAHSLHQRLSRPLELCCMSQALLKHQHDS